MTLSPKDLDAFRLLMREELNEQLEPFREEFSAFRNEVQNNFDALFARDEKREQENAVLDEQAERLERRVESLEKKVA